MNAQQTPTAYQVGLLQHSLGINENRRTPFRNHFMAGDDGHTDMPHLRALEAMGLMTVRDLGPKWGGLSFYVTDTGRALAIAELPPPRKKTRYEEYLDDDCGERFGKWLCGCKLPQYEDRYHYVESVERRQYRMFRRDRDGYVTIMGDWSATKKAAKASYKAKLAKTLPDRRMSRRTDVYNCEGCGRFVGDQQRMSGNCKNCGTDNRP